MTGSESNEASSGLDGSPRIHSLSRLEQHFPWNRLPKELRVKILQNLSRSDLDKCRLLNRETSELVRSNERWMKRRQIEYLSIGCTFRTGVLYSEEGEFKSVVRHLKTFTMVPSYLSRLLKKSNVHHLEIAKGPWTDSHLSSILSSLLETDCHVHRLVVTKASMTTVTSSMLLLFLQELDPIEICFSQVRDCSRDNFSPEVLHFIVTRQQFAVTCLQGELIPIDDQILAKLTASTFVIGAPNMITVDGLLSFIEDMASGKRNVSRGRIFTCFPLDGVTLPKSENCSVTVIMREYCIEIFNFQKKRHE